MVTSKRLTVLTVVVPVVVTTLVVAGIVYWYQRSNLIGMAVDQADWVVGRIHEDMETNPTLWSLSGADAQMAAQKEYLEQLRPHVPALAHVSVISKFGRHLVESGVKQNTSWWANYPERERMEIAQSDVPVVRYGGNERFYPIRNELGEVAGVIRIGLDRDWRQSRMSELFIVLAILVGASFILALIGSLFSFRFRYSQPLNSLVYAIDRFLEGEENRRVEMATVEADARDLAASLNKLFSVASDDRQTILNLRQVNEENDRRYHRLREGEIERSHDFNRLRQSLLARFDVLRRESSDGVIVTDDQGQIIESNAPARRILGLSVGQQGLPGELRKAVGKVLAAKDATADMAEFEINSERKDGACRARVYGLPAELPGRKLALVLLKRKDVETGAVIPTGEILEEIVRGRMEPSLAQLWRRIEQVWPDLATSQRVSPRELESFARVCREIRGACDDLKALAETFNTPFDVPTPSAPLGTLIETVAGEMERVNARPGTLFHLRLASTVVDHKVEAPGLALALRLLLASTVELENDERMSIEAFASGASIVLRLGRVPAGPEGSLLQSAEMWNTGVHEMRRYLAERIVESFGGKLHLENGGVEINVPSTPGATPRVPVPPANRVNQMVQQFLHGVQ